ncbi:MAG: TolC family protein [Sulfurimonas sp.]|uniref:TolC family protein n=1 Tax=Sulfurimonas sp. TaxID=2022749 RepID=UPI0025F7DD44|nr:TolC family protein [Sulfurimonas sp.]MCK9491606.1 TolC family protein [Sulfurimonas sp.]
MKFFLPILCLPLFLYSYTLNELLDLSHSNKVVKSAEHTLASKELLYESSKDSYLPTIDIGANFQNASKETPAVAQNTLKLQASVKYTLYDGNKKNNLYKQLESSIDSSKSNVEATKNSISLDVTRLYFEYLGLEADKEATTQAIEQLKEELKRVEFFYEAGTITKDEVAKIDSRVKNTLVLLQEIELKSLRVLHTLEYYVSQKVENLDGTTTIKLPTVEEKVLRADIKALEQEAISIRHEATIEKSQNRPLVYLDDTFTHSDYYFDNESLKSSFLVENQNIAMVNMTWNIFDFGARTKAYESKLQEYLSKKSLVEYEKDKASVEYRLAKKSLAIAQEKVKSTRAVAEAASLAFKLIKFKYENQTIDNVAYLLALSEKYNAQRDSKRALYELEIRKAELIYFSGKDIKEFL